VNGRSILALLRKQPVDRLAAASQGEIRVVDHLATDRYVIDFSGLLQEGWRQYDTEQDASYFGVWVCRETLETLTYAEGDWSLVTCSTHEAFDDELASMARFYGAPPPAFVVIETETGGVTRYYDERPQ